MRKGRMDCVFLFYRWIAPMLRTLERLRSNKSKMLNQIGGIRAYE